MKRFMSIIVLAIVMLCCMVSTAFAASDEAIAAADELHALGLFNGTGTDANGKPIYDLDRAPTRHEAVIMLIRLLGKEEEASAGTWETPFTDVAEWAKPYIGYAYAHGLTSGTSATTFSGNNPVTASQYLTFILRVLGYEGDFQWNKAWELSDAIGLTSGEYNAKTDEFLRSDIALISENALSTKLKGSNVMLLHKLYNQLSAEKWSVQAEKISVSDYGLPDAIGVTTLSYDDAYALVGKDPAVIAEAVKTVGDVRQYMIAANFAPPAKGPYTPWYGKQEWGFDAPGDEQLRQNYGCCCGGFTNLGLYLLEGDYEEIGVIRWLGGGNHTICYVRHEGKYYSFDLIGYGGGYPVAVMDRLEDFYDKMPEVYPKSEITNLVALRNTTVAYPWGGGGQSTNYLVFPSEMKDHVLQIYQKNSSATISFKDVSIEVPMWNSDKLDAPATNTKYDTYEELKTQYIKLKKSVEVSLLRGDGAVIKEEGRFGGDINSRQRFTVQNNNQTISNYSVKSTDETICVASKDTDGSLLLTAMKKGICTIQITCQGYTQKYYFAVGYGNNPPFDEYINQ